MLTKQCHPVYWSSHDVDESNDDGDNIVRGSWFFEMNGQPLDEVFSERIEKEHLERWKGIDLREIKVPVPSVIKLFKPTINSLTQWAWLQYFY